jgi:hypothetical protein
VENELSNLVFKNHGGNPDAGEQQEQKENGHQNGLVCARFLLFYD